MAVVKVEGSLGKTRFSMEDLASGASGTVLIKRRSQDGEKEFFVPREMVLKFAIAAAGPRVEALLLELMKK